MDQPQPRRAIVIPAAGTGTRFQSTLPKQFHTIGDEPILVRTLRTACAVSDVGSISVGVQGDIDQMYLWLRSHGITDTRLALCLEALVEEFFDDTDRQPFERITKRAGVIRHGRLDASRILWVEARHRPEQQRRIFRADRDQARLIEARSEGDHAVATDTTVRGFDAGDAAERRRLTNRTTRIGRSRRRDDTRSNGRGRATRRAARNHRGVPRVAHGPKMTGLVR